MKCRRIINNNGINSVCYFKSIGLKDSDPIKIEIDPYVAQDPTKEYELKDIKTSSVLEFKVNLKSGESITLELYDKTDGVETILYGESRRNDTLNPNTYTFIYNVKYKFKTNDNKTKNEIKEIFNRKLLNIIIALENQELILKNS